MDTPIYNTIGQGYNNTRCADPYLTERMITNLQPNADGVYLDAGCGTGNYLAAISSKGYKFYGIDPSDTMLEAARAKCKDVTLINATAEQLPFADNSFNGVTATLTLHHWQDIQQGLREIHRVMKPGAKAVLFSFTPQQMYGYWLHKYFPVMIERSADLVPTIAGMEEMFRNAGFTTIETEPYFVLDDLQDHFLYSHKHKPEQYLIQQVRDNASGFRLSCPPNELAHGLEMLEQDINTGEIEEVIKHYENDLGDYLFYVVEK